MKMRLLVITLCSTLWTMGASGKEWKPGDVFLEAVSRVESSNGLFLIGDKGNSLGHFQLSEGAWLDVNQWRKSRQLKTYDYPSNVFNSYINRVYAANYLTILHGHLKKELRRDPTHAELYAAYNMGLKSFEKCGYNLARVNGATRARCDRINGIMRARASM